MPTRHVRDAAPGRHQSVRARLGATAAGTSRTALILAAVATVAACGRAPIEIGTVLAPDGMLGAQLAVEDINAAGGIHGVPLVLHPGPPESGVSAPDAIAAADSLATDRHIVAVIGHSNSTATLAASQIYNAVHMVELSPSSSAPLLSEAGPFTFRLVPSDVHQAAFLLDAIRQEPHGSPARVAIVYVDDDYGRGLEREVRRGLTVAGTPPAYEGLYLEAQPFDSVRIARALTAAHPTLVVWLGRGAQLAALRHALGDPTLPVLASDGVVDAVLSADYGAALDGIAYVRFLDPHPQDPRVTAFAARFLRRAHAATDPMLRTRTQATDFAILSYDAVQLLAQAIRTVGPDREGIRTYLSSLGHARPAAPQLSGRIEFDSTGGAAPRYVLVRATPATSATPVGNATR